MSTGVQAVLLGILGFCTNFEWFLGTCMIQRPGISEKLYFKRLCGVGSDNADRADCVLSWIRQNFRIDEINSGVCADRYGDCRRTSAGHGICPSGTDDYEKEHRSVFLYRLFYRRLFRGINNRCCFICNTDSGSAVWNLQHRIVRIRPGAGCR